MCDYAREEFSIPIAISLMQVTIVRSFFRRCVKAFVVLLTYCSGDLKNLWWTIYSFFYFYGKFLNYIVNNDPESSSPVLPLLSLIPFYLAAGCCQEGDTQECHRLHH